MKTWKQLADLAKSDDLELHRTSSGVTVMTTIGFATPFITIVGGDLVNEDADRVVRVALEAALRELKGLER